MSAGESLVDGAAAAMGAVGGWALVAPAASVLSGGGALAGTSSAAPLVGRAAAGAVRGCAGWPGAGPGAGKLAASAVVGRWGIAPMARLRH